MITYVCTECDEICESEDGYSDCCNEPTVTQQPAITSGVDDGRGHTYSDAELEAPGF